MRKWSSLPSVHASLVTNVAHVSAMSFAASCDVAANSSQRQSEGAQGKGRSARNEGEGHAVINKISGVRRLANSSG